MAKGRGSAAMILTIITISVMICLFAVTESATLVVGNSRGWTFNVANWPKQLKFRSGDILVFKYNPRVHNVVAVDKAGYQNCRASAGSKTYTSGNDQIKLGKGNSYFICSFPGHCESGMKIAVTAA